MKGRKRKGWVSLTVKLNALVLVISLALAGGLSAIAYQVNRTRVDDLMMQTTAQDAATVAAFMDGDFLRELMQAVRTDEFSQVREKALAAEDEEIIRTWLQEKGFYERFDATMKVLATYQEKMDVRFMYVQSVIGDGSVNLCDPSEDLLYLGSVEMSPDEFVAYQTNLRVAPTVSTTDFGWLCSAYEPILASDGEAVAIMGVDLDMNEVMRERHAFLFSMLLFAAQLMVISFAVTFLLMRKMATRPLSMLSKATLGFADRGEGFTQEDVIDLPIRSQDEIGDLYQEIRSMQSRMVEYMQNLTRVTAERERIGAELNIATQIQADMLPRIFPPFPDRHEFEIYATMDPAKEVGGDFYDFFLIDEEHLGLVMADVSGKGVPAALFMVIAKTLIKNRAQMGGGPAETLRYVNDQLCEGNDAELFVTVWFAILDLKTGRGVAANAGHEHPVLRRENGKFELVLYRHSPAVATLAGMKFREHEFEMHPGDTLFVYTDGVPEATNAGNELFGTDRMLDALNREADVAPETLLRNVRKDLDDFVGDAPQFDDITMLGLHYRGPEITAPEG
ncbi:MAG: SpoIIE family protein phosphatase [Clostridia bacterium]|nr:SpoIIE family protein phosphatase [Clostridia bacterium]